MRFNADLVSWKTLYAKAIPPGVARGHKREDVKMKRYTFHVTLLVLVRVKGDTRAESEHTLRSALAKARVDVSMLDERVTFSTIETEGDLDLVDVIECNE